MMALIIHGLHKMKWNKNIYFLALLSIGLFYLVNDNFKSSVNQIIMLFTSNSPEFISGYINSYDIARPLVSIILMVVQAIIVPFNYEIVIFANMNVFGGLMGFSLSLIGRLIGAYICYDIGRLLFAKRIEDIIARVNNKSKVLSYIRKSWLVNIFVRMLPLNFDGVSYFSGIVKLDLKKYMINSTIWIAITSLLYAIKEGYYSYNYEILALVVRIIISALLFVVMVKRYRKNKEI